MNNMHYDIIIVGAGAVGCACARELARYHLKTGVLEKEPDVACGTSGRNSAVVHAGFNNRPGSLMARFCVEGSQGLEKLCGELGVPYRKSGKYLTGFTDSDVETLRRLLAQGEENGCQGLKLISGEEMRQEEPLVGGRMALYSPNTAIINPFLYTVALAENARANGVDFFFESELVRVQKQDGVFRLYCKNGSVYSASTVINCAGLYSADVAALFGITSYHIYPCRGEYFILDKEAQNYVHTPVYPAPRKGAGGLGVHLTPTIDGNIIIGPSAEYIDGQDDYATTKPVMDRLLEEAGRFLPQITGSMVIGSYAGLRAKQAPPREGGFRDFVIREEKDCSGLINLIGIESPGLTASVPIAGYVIDILRQRMKLTEKSDFNPVRRGVPRFRELHAKEQERLVRLDREYGEIICRCETVTKREIRQAIENPLGTVTLSGIKNRTRSMTGRCQGGYCMAKIADILIREYGFHPEDIRLRERGTELFCGRVK